MSASLSQYAWRLTSITQLAIQSHGFFDRLYRLPWYGACLRDWQQWLEPKPNSHILDVGCSSGGLSAELAERGHRVVAIDRSARAIRYARRHHGHSSVDYMTGDALRLPPHLGAMNYTLAASLLNVVQEPAQLVAEMARVTTAGGIVSCLFPSPNMHHEAARDFIREHALTGFSATAMSLWTEFANKLEPVTVMELFRRAGLTDVARRDLLQGMVTAVSGRKRAEDV